MGIILLIVGIIFLIVYFVQGGSKNSIDRNSSRSFMCQDNNISTLSGSPIKFGNINLSDTQSHNSNIKGYIFFYNEEDNRDRETNDLEGIVLWVTNSNRNLTKCSLPLSFFEHNTIEYIDTPRDDSKI